MSGRTGYVYFIQAFSGGPIKIGYSKNPQRRLAQIQTHHPEHLDLIGVVPANRGELEQRLHQELADWRLSGEWFEDSRAVCRVVEALIAPAPEGDVLHGRVRDALGGYVGYVEGRTDIHGIPVVVA